MTLLFIIIFFITLGHSVLVANISIAETVAIIEEFFSFSHPTKLSVTIILLEINVFIIILLLLNNCIEIAELKGVFSHSSSTRFSISSSMRFIFSVFSPVPPPAGPPPRRCRENRPERRRRPDTGCSPSPGPPCQNPGSCRSG